MISLYNITSSECSKLITKKYSTSFSLGIRVFEKRFREPIYSIYGFVRLADEIVDTFYDTDQNVLLQEFKLETEKAIERRISTNPVLQAFQNVVHRYGIEREHIDAFLESMEMDLTKETYELATYKKYIYGSAEVVGLMCLKVFCEGSQEKYDALKGYAISLGSAFQKINFLRDIRSDLEDRGRTYFPKVDMNDFTLDDKIQIEADIQNDFDHAYIGIKQLPKGVRLGVLSAYRYYTSLFNKIKLTDPTDVLQRRIRINNSKKLYLLTSSAFRNQFGLL